MKLKVFNEKKEDENVYLKFDVNPEGITVIAVNNQGKPRHCGRIVTISEKGLNLHHNINENLGFNLDNYGQMIVNKD